MDAFIKFFTAVKKFTRFYFNSVNHRNPSIWVCGEWFGKRTGDNSTYFANYIAEKYPNIQLYWLCDKNCDVSNLNNRIKILDYSTAEAVAVSRKAAVAIMGEGIADLSHDISNYWGNAIKVNLWHGVPWKKIGDDAIKQKSNSFKDFLRKKRFSYDVFETPSDEYTKHIITAFYTNKNNFVSAGLPRNSLFFSQKKIDECKKRLCNIMKKNPSFIISYLPTFRDSHVKPFSFAEIHDNSFLDWLKEKNIYIIQKTHSADKNTFENGTDNVINISGISAQDLMAASDMLVTDYSSCFFDYLLLDRPIIHFIYDYEYYKSKDRGLYYEKDDVLCGSAPENEEDLIKCIKENFENPALYHDLRMKRKEKFMTYENSDSCEQIAQRIFKEIKERKF